MTFKIKAGYADRERPAYYEDDDTTVTYQPDVYRLAELLAERSATSHIVDVGCGRAHKLAAIHRHHPRWTFTGVDYGPNIQYCTTTWHWGRWQTADLERFTPLPLGALIVCADVIEHLVDPTALLASIVAARPTVVVLSTPERDRASGRGHMGPPEVEAHVREWNTAELCALLDDAGLRVRFAGLTRGHDRQALDEAATVVVVATVKGEQ